VFSLLARGPRLEVGASDLTKLGVGAPRIRPLLIDSQIPLLGGICLLIHLYFVVGTPIWGRRVGLSSPPLPSRPCHRTTPLAAELKPTRFSTGTLLFAGVVTGASRDRRAVPGNLSDMFAGAAFCRLTRRKPLRSSGFPAPPNKTPEC